VDFLTGPKFPTPRIYDWKDNDKKDDDDNDKNYWVSSKKNSHSTSIPGAGREKRLKDFCNYSNLIPNCVIEDSGFLGQATVLVWVITADFEGK